MTPDMYTYVLLFGAVFIGIIIFALGFIVGILFCKKQ